MHAVIQITIKNESCSKILETIRDLFNKFTDRDIHVEINHSRDNWLQKEVK